MRHCTFLGQAHVKNKQFKFALKCFYEEVLLCESANALHSNIKISEAYYCAGIVNVEMGNRDRAKESFKKSSEILNFESGEESERLAKSLEQLGSLYTEEHNLTHAILLLTQAHNMYENVLRSNHTSVAMSAFKLGHALNADDHEDLATTQCFIGKNAFALSEMNEAIDSLQKVSLVFCITVFIVMSN